MDPNSQPSPPPRPPPLSDANDCSFRNSCTAICGDGGTSINSVRASIAERRAVKFGFNAQRISTPRFRTTSPLASPSSTAVRSPCITIPPGISPTALLDSPIMLPNSQLSPTTGTFSLSRVNNYESSMPNEASQANGEKKNDGCSSFTFNPHGNPNYFPSFSGSNDQGNNVDCKALVLVKPSMGFEFSAELSHEAIKSCIKDSMPDVKALSNTAASTDFCDIQISGSDAPTSQNSLQAEPFSGNHHPLQEQNGTYTAIGTGRTSEDGYNWRKYGQKQVKGSEYPRSYYKCTHPNCQVTKKIERSHDGQITEIIYKGAHNHPKPQPSRRAQLGSVSWSDKMPETDEGGEACLKVEGGSVWKNMQPGSKDVKVGYDLRADVLERTMSTSVVTELSDPLSTTHGKSMGTYESAETPELSSTLASHDDDDDNDDEATQGPMSIGVNADDDESETKRRKTDTCLVETNLASRAVREPRVVVQIESEVDILDDGYRWRKYGQKVVKGNPNPRSYYKCTSAGCLVRKHVERASHNLKYVITTYEGKHNHEVPAARNSSHVNASGSNLSQAIVSAQPALTMTRNTNGPKTEAQIQRFTMGFERKQELNKECLRPLVGNLSNEMKLGASSFYPMKCPSIQHTMPYGGFGINTSHGASPFAGPITSLVPDFPIPVPSSLQTTANLSLAGVTFGNNKLGGEIRPFFTGQQLIRPKQEQRDDNPYNAGPCIMERVNASSSSVYNGSIMGNFPS